MCECAIILLENNFKLNIVIAGNNNLYSVQQSYILLHTNTQ